MHLNCGTTYFSYIQLVLFFHFSSRVEGYYQPFMIGNQWSLLNFELYGVTMAAENIHSIARSLVRMISFKIHRKSAQNNSTHTHALMMIYINFRFDINACCLETESRRTAAAAARQTKQRDTRRKFCITKIFSTNWVSVFIFIFVFFRSHSCFRFNWSYCLSGWIQVQTCLIAYFILFASRSSFFTFLFTLWFLASRSVFAMNCVWVCASSFGGVCLL